MARSPMQLPSQTQQFETVVHDRDGAEILRIGMRVYSTVLFDGTMMEHRISDSIETVDGVSWDPSFLRQNPPIQLIACSACRRPSIFEGRPPSHGLCTANGASRCASCGVACCPRHRRLCPDRRFRCWSCARRFRFRWWLKRVFYARVEED